jgi:hypothetical protein
MLKHHIVGEGEDRSGGKSRMYTEREGGGVEQGRGEGGPFTSSASTAVGAIPAPDNFIF